MVLELLWTGEEFTSRPGYFEQLNQPGPATSAIPPFISNSPKRFQSAWSDRNGLDQSQCAGLRLPQADPTAIFTCRGIRRHPRP